MSTNAKPAAYPSPRPQASRPRAAASPAKPNGVALALDVPAEVVEQIAEIAAAIVTELERPAAPWLDTKGAADYLACRPDRIHDLVQLGKLHPHRDGRRLLFRPADLDAYLEASR
jgi:excisionase family DNA binding protein